MLLVKDNVTTTKLVDGSTFEEEISSIIVREGCTFRGYYFHKVLGDSEVVLKAEKRNWVVKDLDDVSDQDDMDDAIEHFVCTCPVSQCNE